MITSGKGSVGLVINGAVWGPELKLACGARRQWDWASLARFDSGGSGCHRPLAKGCWSKAACQQAESWATVLNIRSDLRELAAVYLYHLQGWNFQPLPTGVPDKYFDWHLLKPSRFQNLQHSVVLFYFCLCFLLQGLKRLGDVMFHFILDVISYVFSNSSWRNVEWKIVSFHLSLLALIYPFAAVTINPFSWTWILDQKSGFNRKAAQLIVCLQFCFT